MLKVGFTGSRRGMTKLQTAEWLKFIVEHHPFELHHGDCIGADAQGHMNYYTYPEKGKRIVIHPPINDTYRAFTHLSFDWTVEEVMDDTVVEVRPEKEYLDRNADIVNDTEFLVAFPNRDTVHKGKGGGGTWSTVRYARAKGKKVIVVYQNGNIDVLDN